MAAVIQQGSRGADVAKLQNLLNSALKLNPPLEVDGAFGPNTHDATLRFQALRGLETDGIVGPQTWMALGQTCLDIPQVQPLSPTRADAPWMAIAEAEMGVHEDGLPGQHNRRIVEYHGTTTLKATTDETPWCSSFVNWVLVQAGYRGTNNALAKSWLDWGGSLVNPRPGAITVILKKKRGTDAATGSSTGYHVGFFVSATGTSLRLLGGNQSDRVKYSDYLLSAYDIQGYRWPA